MQKQEFKAFNRLSDKKLHFACEELELSWEPIQVKNFRKMWKKGISLKTIAEELQRDIDECAILVIDQARRGRIEQRQNGIWGG